MKKKQEHQSIYFTHEEYKKYRQSLQSEGHKQQIDKKNGRLFPNQAYIHEQFIEDRENNEVWIDSNALEG